MKKPYQIAGGRAVQRVRKWAEEENPAVQLVLPMIEILTLAKQGAGELIREAGLQLILLAMGPEIEALTGARYQRSPSRQAQRWSCEDDFVVVDGQKVPIQRRRLRGKHGGEVRLGTYELFQQTRHLDDQVWWKMLRGLTTRNYPLVTRSFAQAYGIEKSAISERFIQASREKLKALMERPLGELKLCAIVIDGTPFKGRQMIAAIGVAHDGKKTVLGLREGATENATVVRELLEDLARRGLDFSAPRLYVLDGAKALSAAVKRHAGQAAVIQRCQVHKRRNVLAPVARGVPAGHQAEADRGLCDDGRSRRPPSAGSDPSGVGKDQSQRRTQPGRGHGRNAHSSQTADAGDAAQIVGFHQHHRIGILRGRGTLPAGEALARRRSSGALGRIGTFIGRE